MEVKNVTCKNLVALILLIFHGADGQLTCNYGMKSTIKSLNPQLDPASSEKCRSQHVCGVAKMAITYLGETGQGKLGSCVPISFCSDGIGCQLALKFLPTGVSSQGCKVQCCVSERCNSLSVSKGSNGKLTCNYGMKSTIKSLQLATVTSTTCQSQEICGVATMKTKYLGETGQSKLGTCVPQSYCTDAAGCQLAQKFLPTGVSSQECKVQCCDSDRCNSLSVSKNSSSTLWH